jgi:hypothetical protein
MYLSSLDFVLVMVHIDVLLKPIGLHRAAAAVALYWLVVDFTNHASLAS